MRKFTNFNKLYTFSIVAKYLSFSIAAEKLFITQAAVSQQIKSLETILKYPLFRRLNKNIALTKQGEKLLKTIDTKFSDIQDNIEKINSNDLTGVLTIDTLPSFAMKWLIPRLNRFNTLYPNINIHISTSLNLVDFNKDEVDMAIRYGHEADAKTYCIKLMDEDTFLVASPALLKKHPLTIAKDLRHHTLLYDEIDCFY
jgi:LysR family glycine cleavage system transcriptional activator